jgi:hypothetical protein
MDRRSLPNGTWLRLVGGVGLVVVGLVAVLSHHLPSSGVAAIVVGLGAVVAASRRIVTSGRRP